MGEVARGPTYYILGWVSREEEERAHSHHPWYIGLIGLVVMVSIAIIYFKFFFKYCQTCSYNSPPLSSPSSHNRLDEYYFWRSFVNISLPPPPPPLRSCEKEEAPTSSLSSSHSLHAIMPIVLFVATPRRDHEVDDPPCIGRSRLIHTNPFLSEQRDTYNTPTFSNKCLDTPTLEDGDITNFFNNTSHVSTKSNTLPKQYFASTLVDTCSICLSPFCNLDPLRICPSCSYPFHASCIDPWLLLHSHPTSSCPLCRSHILHQAKPISLKNLPMSSSSH